MTNIARPTTVYIKPLADTLPLADALSALDDVIARHGPEQLLTKPPEKSASDALAAALRDLCTQARSVKSEGAESMVIALHAAWPRLPAVRRLAPREKTDLLLDCIVSLAISEFYSPTSTTGRGVELMDETPTQRAKPETLTSQR